MFWNYPSGLRLASCRLTDGTSTIETETILLYHLLIYLLHIRMSPIQSITHSNTSQVLRTTLVSAEPLPSTKQSPRMCQALFTISTESCRSSRNPREPFCADIHLY